MHEEKSAEANGVRITVVSVPDDLAGWGKFEATAVNTSDGPRTVNGTISLHQNGGDPAGACTVYMELPPGQTVQDTFTAKVAEQGFDAWAFELIRVYDF